MRRSASSSTDLPTLFAILPGLRAQRIEARRLTLVPYVTLDKIRLLDGHKNFFLAGIIDADVIPLEAEDGEPLNAAESAYSVVDVHHVIARRKFDEALDRRTFRPCKRARHMLAPSKELMFGEHAQFQGRKAEARRNRPLRDGDGVILNERRYSLCLGRARSDNPRVILLSLEADQISSLNSRIFPKYE